MATLTAYAPTSLHRGMHPYLQRHATRNECVRECMVAENDVLKAKKRRFTARKTMLCKNLNLIY